VPDGSAQSRNFPLPSGALESFGMKFTAGGSHISRTMMLGELEAVLGTVPADGGTAEYRAAVVDRNILAKTTVSTRLKSLRHLRELYALDGDVPIFAVLRTLERLDAGASLPLLALLAAWSRDPLLRATTPPVLGAQPGAVVGVQSLVEAIDAAYPNQYTAISSHRVARNAASTWTQSGHLLGRLRKVRRGITPTLVPVVMALFLGDVAGYRGPSVFGNPWCRLLDLSADRARAMALEAHRAGLLNFRAVGEVVEISFPMFTNLQVRV
jgi:hypothetical protein